MNYHQIYDIATQGLNAEKLRIDVVANNIANQHTLKFQPSQVITTAKPFTALLQEGEGGLESIELAPQEVRPNKVYQPDHPSADAQGYVTYPGVSTLDEMTTLIRSSRAYEANIKMINAAHNLFLQALTIGDER